MQDREIIDLYFARDERALTETAEKYGAYCFKVALNIVSGQEDAEECVNDTYLAAWNTIPPTVPDILKYYLAKITRGKALDRWKMMHTKKRGGDEMTLVLDELAECAGTMARPEDEILADELAEKINAFLGTLSVRDRQLFVRRYYFTEPVGQIAWRAGMSENGAAVVLHRTREKLRNYLAKEGYLV